MTPLPHTHSHWHLSLSFSHQLTRTKPKSQADEGVCEANRQATELQKQERRLKGSWSRGLQKYYHFNFSQHWAYAKEVQYAKGINAELFWLNEQGALDG